jgi:hypothetical protein
MHFVGLVLLIDLNCGSPFPSSPGERARDAPSAGFAAMNPKGCPGSNLLAASPQLRPAVSFFTGLRRVIGDGTPLAGQA